MDSMSGGFNETFINSLPENIRNDLIDGQMQDEAPATSTDPQTRITKLENSLQQAERSLNSIRSELNADILRRTDNSMLRFGESFFHLFSQHSNLSLSRILTVVISLM